MKIAQLNSSRARGTQELDHHHLSIKFKRHRSQRFYFVAQLLTPKTNVELSKSKKCRDQKVRINQYPDHHSLCI